MATYSKLGKVCQDFALGYPDLNQAIANTDAMRDAYAAKHGTKEPAPSNTYGTNPWQVAGHHNDPLVTRTIARVHTVFVSGVLAPQIDVLGPAISGITRIGTGQWQVDIDQLSNWWLFVNIEASSNTPCRKAVVYTSGGSAFISLYDLSAGTFALTDLDFDVQVWGEL